MAQVIAMNFAFTLMLTGLIWTIQLVHYPSFQFIAKEEYSNFMYFHMRRITYIVAPLMILELLVSTYLVIHSFNTLTLINVTSVFLIWLSTMTLSVPCHNRLTKGYDKKTISTLILTNWPRTILWSLKAGVSIAIVNQ